MNSEVRPMLAAAMRSLTVPVIFMLVCLCPSLSHADQVHTHDGFMLRLTGGLGYGSVSSSSDALNAELEVTGVAGLFSLDLGGTVGENLILHARLSNLTIVEPTVELNGMEFETNDVSLAMPMFGVGLTYYVMPANLYFTAAVGFSEISLQVDGDEIGESDMGLGVDLDVGREWWVGRDWGLGVAGRLHYTTASDKNTDETISGVGFGVLFTATYN